MRDELLSSGASRVWPLASCDSPPTFAMERQYYTPGTSTRRASVLAVTCAAHALAVYFIGIQTGVTQTPLWHPLDVSFIPSEPTEPPPPPPIPVVLSDAFATQPLIDVPAPEAEIAMQTESTTAITQPVVPAPPPAPDVGVDEGEGYGPLTKPRVVSGPRYPQDRYPRISIRHKESGRTIVKICISESGNVVSAEVARTSGYPRLDDAAVDMSLDYVFSPAMRDGKAIPVCLPYGIDFKLSVGGLRRH